MPTAEHALTVDVAPEAIWSVLSDPLRLPDWVYGVRRVDFVTDARRGVGAQWRQVNGWGPVVITLLNEITQEDAPRVFTVESASRPHVETRHALTPVGDAQTEVRVIMHYELPLGPVGRVAEPVIGENVGHAIVRRSLENLKRLVEKEKRRAQDRERDADARGGGGADQPPVAP